MGEAQVVFLQKYCWKRKGRRSRKDPKACNIRGGRLNSLWVVPQKGRQEKEGSEEEDPPRKRRLLVDIYRSGPSKKAESVSSITPTTSSSASAAWKNDSCSSTNVCRSEGRSRFYEDVVCNICKRGDDEHDLLLCDECDGGYHMYCLCPILVRLPRGNWFCPLCSKKDRIKEFPLVQTKLIDFFRIQRPLTDFSETEAKRRKRSSICYYKKKRKLLPHVPSKDPVRRLQQMASLATALASTGMEFSDELTYMPGLALESANCSAFESSSMQVIGKEDKVTFDLCKLMCSRGEWPPLMVTYDPRQGFVVEADSHIKDMTLIAEYTGDVDYMKNRLQDESNCLMGLLYTKDSSKELVICPDRRGNIARFISGINNHTLEGRKKQNLRCVRFDINGQARVVLVAIRDIAKGERLYYDYNAFRKEYPTQHFV